MLSACEVTRGRGGFEVGGRGDEQDLLGGWKNAGREPRGISILR